MQAIRPLKALPIPPLLLRLFKFLCNRWESEILESGSRGRRRVHDEGFVTTPLPRGFTQVGYKGRLGAKFPGLGLRRGLVGWLAGRKNGRRGPERENDAGQCGKTVGVEDAYAGWGGAWRVGGMMGK